MTGLVMVTKSTVGCGGGKGGGGGGRSKSTVEEEEQNQQLSLVEFLLTALRKSVISCRVDNNGQDDVVGGGGISSAAVHHMEIGWPTNVRHITHVTFDRFHGFLGLPHELQVEIPCRVPSARYNKASDFET